MCSLDIKHKKTEPYISSVLIVLISHRGDRCSHTYHFFHYQKISKILCITVFYKIQI